MFGNRLESEKITIYEIKHSFMRPPLNLSKQHSKILSKFLIEDGTSPYTYNKYLHKKFDIVTQKLSKLAGSYSLFDAANDSSIHKSVAKKVGPLVNDLSTKLNLIREIQLNECSTTYYRK